MTISWPSSANPIRRYQLIPYVFLILLVASALPTSTAAADPNHSTTVPSTQPVLSLTIHCDQSALKAGDAIPITFVIKNEGSSPYQYMDRNYDNGGRMEEYKLVATDLSGAPVPDPRAKRAGGIAGGIASTQNLRPGQSFTKTIDLNRWALVTRPGTYHVTGTYFTELFQFNEPGINSPPIQIVVQRRTDAEMGAYIQGLASQLKVSLQHKAWMESQQKGDDGNWDELLQELMFTCDDRIVPTLIDALYQDKRGDTVFWVEEAFTYYLPTDGVNTAALVQAATARGMASGMYICLKACGCPREQFNKLIAISLSPDHPDAWGEGAAAAQEYCDDSFTPRLIAIATGPRSEARFYAICALALNRTDESVAVLKRLLRDTHIPPNEAQSVAQQTADAIRDAYLYRGNSDGRKLRPNDFGPEYQRPQ